MTKLSKEETNAYWTTIKSGWKKIKDQSVSEADKETVKKDINEAQKALGLDVTTWNEKKSTSESSQKTYLDERPNVNWIIDGKANQQEIDIYNNVVVTAYHIVKTRHPKMDPNSNTFGTIMSAVCGHLIALRN